MGDRSTCDGNERNFKYFAEVTARVTDFLDPLYEYIFGGMMIDTTLLFDVMVFCNRKMYSRTSFSVG